MSCLMLNDLVDGQIVAFSDAHSCNYKVMSVLKKTTKKVILKPLNGDSPDVEYSLVTGKRLNYVFGVEYSFDRIWSIEEAMMRREQEQNAMKMSILWEQLSEAVDRRNIDVVTEFVNAINTANFLSLNKMEYMTK